MKWPDAALLFPHFKIMFLMSGTLDFTLKRCVTRYFDDESPAISYNMTTCK